MSAVVHPSSFTPAASPTASGLDGIRRKFHTLDGMRGVAAILVITRHGQQFFAPLQFPNSFLAVDLFFMLSGFVIAAAYDRRLATGALTPSRFMIVRFIRLWPLYLLGTLLGTIMVYFKISHGKSTIDLWTFWLVVPGQLLMIPSLGTTELYALIPVAWSLAFEMLVNAIYAFFHKRLSTSALLLTAAVSIVGLYFGLYTNSDGLNNGWGWHFAWVGFARVGFAFPIGVLLFRYRSRMPHLKLPSLLVLVILAAILMLNLPAQLNDAAQIMSIVVVFPLLVIAGSEVEPARWLVPVCTWLGVTSYAMYTLHNALLVYFEFGLSKIHLVFSDYAPWSGFIAVAVILLIAWAADRFYDAPVRVWLTAHTRRREQRVEGRGHPVL